MTQTVIHIVPQLPPINSGVGDYASLVGRRMEEIGDGAVCGYVAAGQNASELPADGPRVRNVTGRCEGNALWGAVEEVRREIEPSPGPSLKGRGSVAVVLHFSGYGYDRNGCPDWLVEALRERLEGVGRVVTYFHELYATGRPWQRAFWYSSRQQSITAEIARLSDEVLTNVAQSARWLEDQAGRSTGSVTSLPVPSNVGEPAEVLDYALRRPRAVAFGGARSKRFALYDEAPRAAALLQRLGIVELVDIGSPCPLDRRAYERCGITVRQLGYVAAPEVSGELLECRVGFLDYPLAVVAKSSVFAAYAAHGVVPIFRNGYGGTADGIIIGKQALALAAVTDGLQAGVTLQHLCEPVRKWYGAGSITHANELLGRILPTRRIMDVAEPRHIISTID